MFPRFEWISYKPQTWAICKRKAKNEMHIEKTPGRNFKRLKLISGDSDEKEALLQDAKENLTENINLVVKLSEEILGFV